MYGEHSLPLQLTKAHWVKTFCIQMLRILLSAHNQFTQHRQSNNEPLLHPSLLILYLFFLVNSKKTNIFINDSLPVHSHCMSDNVSYIATLQLRKGLLTVYCPLDLVRSIGTCFSVRSVNGFGILELFGIIASDTQICSYLLLCVWNRASVSSFYL